MSDRPVVMISSTAKDLPEHRKQVMDACRYLQFDPRWMEDLPASDQNAIEASLAMVDESAIYVGIFAHRYGHVPSGHSISITEMEYNRAVERQIPCLIFLMDDDYPVRRADVETGPGAEKLEALKKKLRARWVVAEFRSPEDLHRRVLQSLIRLRDGAPSTKTDVYSAAIRAAYLQRLAEAFQWIDLGGLAPQVGNELLRLPLEAVFVHRHVQQDVPLLEELSREEFRLRRVLEQEGADSEEISRRMDRLAAKLQKQAASESPPDPRRQDVSEIFNHPRVVVLGDPGAGKSTLLRYFGRSLAVGGATTRRSTDAGLLPVYVRLGDYDEFCEKQGTVSLLDFVPRSVAAREWGLSLELLNDELTHGRCLFLLDGMDEIVHTGRRKQVRDRIQELARGSGECRLIVTSRIVGYRSARLPPGDAGFAHFTLAEFDDAEIRHFAEHWYEAIRMTGDPIDPGRQNSEALLRGIHGLHGVRRLATNPLLLTLIALMYWRGTSLPKRRIELYGGATKTLLKKWVEQRTPDVRIDESVATPLLMAVAFHIHSTSSAGLISRPELERLLQGLMTDPDLSNLAELPAAKAVEEFLGTQGEHVGLLYPRGLSDCDHEVFGFLHLTFEEYLAGRELARRWKQQKDRLTQFLHHSRWEEPILLACSHLSDDDDRRGVNEFVRQILEAGSPYEQVLHRDLLLAARCLADDVSVSRDLARRIFDQLNAVFSTSLGPLNARIGAVIGEMGGSRLAPEAVKLLLQKTRDPNKHVRSTAVQALGVFAENRLTQEIVNGLRSAVLDQEDLVRQSATTALVAAGKAGGAEVTGVFLTLARDGEPGVRHAAAHALDGTSPEVLDALRTLLRDDEPIVRRAAARRLNGLWAKIPKVRGIFLEVLHDGKLDVRQIAIEVLGRRIPACDSEVVSAFRSLLQNLEPEIRKHAARELGRLRDSVNPERVNALGSLLYDGEAEVRETAIYSLLWLGSSPGSSVRDQVAIALRAFLDDDNSGVRLAAAGSLRELGPSDRPEVVDTLRSLLQDGEANVRKAAATELGKLGAAAGPEVVDALRSLLRDGEAQVREEAVQALSQLGASVRVQATDTLLEFLADGNPGVRLAAARRLRESGDSGRPEVVNALRSLLQDGDANIRREATRELGKFGASAGPEVVDAVRSLLHDGEAEVRLEAARSLNRLGQASAEVAGALRALLRNSNTSVQNWAAWALVESGNSDDALRALLRDSEPLVRRAAIEAPAELGWSIRSKMVDDYRALLRDGDSKVRLAATWAWNAFGTGAESEVMESFCSLLRDKESEVRLEATNLLARMSTRISPEVVDALRDLLRDENREVREAAARQLAGLDEVAATKATLDQLAETVTGTQAGTDLCNLAFSALSQLVAYL